MHRVWGLIIHLSTDCSTAAHVVAFGHELLCQQLRGAVSCCAGLSLGCHQLGLQERGTDLRVLQLLLQQLDVHRNGRSARGPRQS